MATAAGAGTNAPLKRYGVASTTRTDEAIEVISRTYCGHEVRVIDRVSALRFHFCEARLDRTTLGAMSFDADFHYDLGNTESYFLIQFADSGAIEYVNGGETCEVTRERGMVTSPTRPLRIRYGETSRGIIFKICKRALERHLGALLGTPVGRPLIFDAPIPPETTFSMRYRRLLDYIVRELEAEAGFAGIPPLVASLEDMVMTALLTGQRHNYSRRFETQPPPATLHHVERIEDYVRADPARPFTIMDFALLTGISGRSLHRAFRRHRGYSPMAFVRAARLHRARTLLAQGEAGATVTVIANECGFDHLGRFGQDYAARYGEPPSHTLRRARARRGAIV